jgi:uncharacterized protein (TIGR01244 family)
MLNMIPLDEHMLVSAQITPADIDDIAKAGIKLVVNNRPDGEALMGQPASAEIEAAARERGMDFLDLPFTMATLTPQHVATMADALRHTQGRVLAYCRSGSRSSMLWAAAQVANGAEVDAVLAQAQNAGIDLAQARPLIDGLGRAAAGIAEG